VLEGTDAAANQPPAEWAIVRECPWRASASAHVLLVLGQGHSRLWQARLPKGRTAGLARRSREGVLGLARRSPQAVTPGFPSEARRPYAGLPAEARMPYAGCPPNPEGRGGSYCDALSLGTFCASLIRPA